MDEEEIVGELTIDKMSFIKETEEQSFYREFYHKNSVAGKLRFNTLIKANPVFKDLNNDYKKAAPGDKPKEEDKKKTDPKEDNNNPQQKKPEPTEEQKPAPT